MAEKPYFEICLTDERTDGRTDATNLPLTFLQSTAKNFAVDKKKEKEEEKAEDEEEEDEEEEEAQEQY